MSFKLGLVVIVLIIGLVLETVGALNEAACFASVSHCLVGN